MSRKIFASKQGWLVILDLLDMCKMPPVPYLMIETLADSVLKVKVITADGKYLVRHNDKFWVNGR